MISEALFRAFRENETKVHELDYLFWECTSRCNLHCRHCGSDCLPAGTSPDMPLEDFLAALDTIPSGFRPKGFTVVITGGEPLLRPDIVEAGREIKRRGFGWGMVSNGFHYTPRMHNALLAAGMGALTISLDGLRESHNWMRGNNLSWDRAVEAITLAASSQFLNFDVVTCVNKRNIAELEEMYSLLESRGVKQWRIFTIIPIGRAVDEPQLHLSDEEFHSLMDFIVAKRNAPGRKMKVTFSCEGYLGPYEKKVRDNRYFCHAGINIASVLIDGRICACPNIDRDVFSQGSIYTDNFYEVWQNRFEPFRDRSWARKGKCAGCKSFRDCLGNGMHNWHGSCQEVLNCHLSKILPTD